MKQDEDNSTKAIEDRDMNSDAQAKHLDIGIPERTCQTCGRLIPAIPADEINAELEGQPGIPLHPDIIYQNNGWSGWCDFLGSDSWCDECGRDLEEVISDRAENEDEDRYFVDQFFGGWFPQGSERRGNPERPAPLEKPLACPVFAEVKYRLAQLQQKRKKPRATIDNEAPEAGR
jgi:hypothetical protein